MAKKINKKKIVPDNYLKMYGPEIQQVVQKCYDYPDKFKKLSEDSYKVVPATIRRQKRFQKISEDSYKVAGLGREGRVSAIIQFNQGQFFENHDLKANAYTVTNWLIENLDRNYQQEGSYAIIVYEDSDDAYIAISKKKKTLFVYTPCEQKSVINTNNSLIDVGDIVFGNRSIHCGVIFVDNEEEYQKIKKNLSLNFVPIWEYVKSSSNSLSIAILAKMLLEESESFSIKNIFEW